MNTETKHVIIEKVRAYIKEQHMLGQNDKVAAGVSGGADSICLLFVLTELQQEFGFELMAVHVNHGLRGEDANRDEAYVKSLCEQLKLPYRLCHIDVEALAAKRGLSVEEAGREARLQAFEQAVQEDCATKIALAHHKNDNAETFLMNLARGSGLKGLGGIRPVNQRTIRPLLCLKRQEIEEYLKTEGIAYCTDLTNESDIYTRNRIRSHVLPYLEQHVNVRTVDHMNETMEQLRELQEYMDAQVAEMQRRCVRENVIRKEVYESIPQVLRKPLLQKVLGQIAGKEKDLGNLHFTAVDELMQKQTGKEISLPYGMRAVRCYDGIRVETGKKDEAAGPKKASGLSMEYRILGREEWQDVLKKSETPYTKWFDYDIIKSNLCVRTRMPGDYIEIDERGNRQKLKAYFINEKIPADIRDRVPLVADGSHIVWIVGRRTSYAYRVKTDTNQILEITITGGNIHGRES